MSQSLDAHNHYVGSLSTRIPQPIDASLCRDVEGARYQVDWSTGATMSAIGTVRVQRHSKTPVRSHAGGRPTCPKHVHHLKALAHLRRWGGLPPNMHVRHQGRGNGVALWPCRHAWTGTRFLAWFPAAAEGARRRCWCSKAVSLGRPMVTTVYALC